MIFLGLIVGSFIDSIKAKLFEKSIEQGVGLSWIKILPNARGKGLGDAYLTIGNNPSIGMWNPGAIGQCSDGIEFTHMAHFVGIRSENFAISKKKGKGVYNLYLSGTFVKGLEYRESKPTPQPLGYFNCYGFVIGVGYGRKLEEGLNVGGVIKLVQEKIFYYTTKTLLVDAGLTYMGIKDLWFGIALVNYGKYPKFRKVEIKPPRGVRVGVSYTKFNTLLSIQINKYRDEILQPNIGIEYSLREEFVIRGGYSFWVDTYSFSCGFGIKLLRGWRLDYAFRDYKIGLGEGHFITILR
jgi:hypothetical protein